MGVFDLSVKKALGRRGKRWRNLQCKYVNKLGAVSKIFIMRMLDLYCGLKKSDSKYDRQETTEA